MDAWVVDVSVRSESPISDDATRTLSGLLGGVPVGRSADLKVAELSMTVSAPSVLDAANKAAEEVRNAARPLIGAVDIVGMEVLKESDAEADALRPVFPDVVGYAEIAREASLSRQRVRELAESSSFPEPVIKTAQGPLFAKTAVLAWLENRNTKAGRPTRVATV
jgi:hypothetical protein